MLSVGTMTAVEPALGNVYRFIANVFGSGQYPV